MKVIRGRKSIVGCIVELTEEGYTTQLSLEKSLQVVDHAPDGFQWGYNGSGPAQLSAAILYEVTSNEDLARQYYQIFKHDQVAQWGETFEINEHQVLAWLSTVGALQVNVVDTAKIEFEAFNQLYEKAFQRWKRASGAGQGHQVLEAIPPCENAISLTQDWVEKYKPHIQELRPFTSKAFEWMPMIEEIRKKLRQFRILLSYRQADRPLLETADKIREEVEELLENHCYLLEV
ncbi:hypothetical protein F4Z99_02885 [Candidatus Poribacteria bacterium]|nr:hypothetical protein [Candidatus Poribacteria bacterium]MYA99230.1 hypothetical protein [Candidatus Poribacteria bacterium]